MPDALESAAYSAPSPPRLDSSSFHQLFIIDQPVNILAVHSSFTLEIMVYVSILQAGYIVRPYSKM